MELELRPEQQLIVEAAGNVIVTAAAGTGKTLTLVRKVIYDIERNDDYRRVAAITFTLKAAQEIKDRLPKEAAGHFISTNNQFAIREIIPFFEDAFGIAPKGELQPDYDTKLNTWDELFALVCETGRVAKYVNLKKNFIFELATQIIKASEACRLFLQAKYFKIYVDEYQDCDIDMHNFFMCLCKELSIHHFLVGDLKQFIYGWKGAQRESFERLLQDDDFEKYRLDENFRCCQQIQNFANLLYPNEMSCLYKECELNGEVIVVNTCTGKVYPDIIQTLNSGTQFAVLRRSNDSAQHSAGQLTMNGFECQYIKTPAVCEIYTKDGWLYYELARYYILSGTSEYDIMRKAPEELQDERTVDTLRTLLETVPKNRPIEADLRLVATKILSLFGYSPSDKNIQLFVADVLNHEMHPAFHPEDYPSVAMTIHSAKGAAFDQVILFGDDFKFWTIEDIDLLYVAATRAKKKLIIVTTDTPSAFGSGYCKLLKESKHHWSEVFSLLHPTP